MRYQIIFFTAMVALTVYARPGSAASTDVTNLNNEGVHALNTDDFDLAADKFKSALKLDPGYVLAKLNLAIVYKKSGLKYQSFSPQRSLKYFREAVLVNPFDKSAQKNLDELLEKLGRDPHSFIDRATLGKQSEDEGDIKSAIVEYWFALRNKNDGELARKLEIFCRTLRKDEPYLVDLSSMPIKTIESPVISSSNVPEPSEADDKFAPYMHALQPTIRSHWAPPHAETSYKVILEFKIRRTGDVSNLGIFLSSGSAEADAAALQAVKDSVPLPPLPKNEPDADIQFTFDYNYFSHQYTVRDIEIVKSWHGFRSGVLPIIRM
jgi:TonB family protein